MKPRAKQLSSDVSSGGAPGLTDPDVIAYRDAQLLLNSQLTELELNALLSFVQGARARNLWRIEEFYLPLGTTLTGKLLRLKPLFEMNNEGFELSDFTSQGLAITNSSRLTSTVVGVNLSEFSFGVYVNRAAGLEWVDYAGIGQGTNGVQITTTPSEFGGHGLYPNHTFSNQRISPSQVGFFSGSFVRNGLRVPYINGIRATAGPNSTFNHPNIGLRIQGGGQTRISGGYATSLFLNDADQSGLYAIFHQFMVATGQAF